jgi:hypothetical protein
MEADMWNKCPDCKKTFNYVPVWSWFEKRTDEQCEECAKLEQMEISRWEDEGGNPEVEFGGGQHIAIEGKRVREPVFSND